MTRPILGFFCALVTLAALSGEARAEDGTFSAGPLLFRGCDSSERLEVARLVALDLSSSDGLAQPEPGSIAVTCQAARFDIAITRGANQTLTRSIDLEPLPARARPRIVAIAVVELFAADGAESAGPAPLPSPPAPPEASRRQPTPTTTPTNCCRLELALAASGRTFFHGIPPLLGGGMRAATEHGLLALDGLAEFGAQHVPEGRAHLASLSSSATVGWSTTPGVATFRMAAGARGGVVRLSGEPTDPLRWSGRSAWRGWGGPKLEATLALHPTTASVVQLTTESGYTLFAVHTLGSEGREVEIRGVWLGFQMGFGITL